MATCKCVPPCLFRVSDIQICTSLGSLCAYICAVSNLHTRCKINLLLAALMYIQLCKPDIFIPACSLVVPYCGCSFCLCLGRRVTDGLFTCGSSSCLFTTFTKLFGSILQKRFRRRQATDITGTDNNYMSSRQKCTNETELSPVCHGKNVVCVCIHSLSCKEHLLEEIVS